jgi:hypothetical protein
MRNGVMKKGDVKDGKCSYAPFSLDDLAEMIDVSASSKYEAGLEGMTPMLMDSLHGSFESFKLDSKHDAEERLARQVRSVVQQVLGEVKGKGEVETMGVGVNTSNNNIAASAGIGGQAQVVNPNLQQPYCQAQAYGPWMQTIQDPYYPRPPIVPPPTGGHT